MLCKSGLVFSETCGDSYSIDHRLLFPDSRVKHVHEQCETFYADDGKPLRSVGTVQDITERKLAEEKLKEEMDVTTHLLMMAEAAAKATDVDTLMSEVIRCGHMIAGCDTCLSYLWDKEQRCSSRAGTAACPTSLFLSS